MTNEQPLRYLIEEDHARLLRLLDDAQTLAQDGSRFSAAKVFGGFRRLIEHHMDEEERALSELHTRGTCRVDLIISVVDEHDELRVPLDAAWRSIDEPRDELVRAFEALSAMLAVHERREQTEVLPLLTSSVDNPTALRRAVQRLVDA